MEFDRHFRSENKLLEVLVIHAFKPSIQEVESGKSEFGVRLVYRVHSKKARGP